MRESSNHRNILLVWVMAALGVASMFIVVAVLAKSITYRVSAGLVVPADRAQRCVDLLESSSPRVTYEKTLVTPTANVFEVWRDVAEPARAQSEMDALTAQVIERISSIVQTKLAVDPEMQTLESRLHQINEQLAKVAASQPAHAETDIQKLTDAWQQKIELRQTLKTQIKQLDEGMTGKMPDEAGVVLDSAVVAAALARDPKLQADMQALKDREARLSRQLDDLLRAGEPLLERFTATVITADTLVNEHAEEEKTTELATALAALRKHLSNWQKSATALSQVWLKQHTLLAAPDGDPLAVEAALESAAKTMLQDVGATKSALNKTLESIGEGSDQPTKRLVLRNALSQELAESTDAFHALTEAARSLILVENHDLSAIADTVVGLRTKCRQQQEQMVVALRHEAFAKLRSQNQTEQAATQGERSKLLARADEAEAALLQTARQLLDAVKDDRNHRGLLVQARDLQQQRADLLTKWLALSSQHPQISMRVTPVFIPARATPLLPTSPELVRAFYWGAGPLAVGMLLWMLIALPAALKRSRQARAEYTEILQTASSKKDRAV